MQHFLVPIFFFNINERKPDQEWILVIFAMVVQCMVPSHGSARSQPSIMGRLVLNRVLKGAPHCSPLSQTVQSGFVDEIILKSVTQTERYPIPLMETKSFFLPKSAKIQPCLVENSAVICGEQPLLKNLPKSDKFLMVTVIKVGM